MNNNNKKTYKITTENIINICYDFANNESITEIANKYNIAYNTVKRIINAKKNKKYIIERQEQIKINLNKVFNKKSAVIYEIIDKSLNALNDDKKINSSSLLTLANTITSLINNKILLNKSDYEIKKQNIELKKLSIELLKLKKELKENKTNNNINANQNNIIFNFNETLKNLVSSEYKKDIENNTNNID